MTVFLTFLTGSAAVVLFVPAAVLFLEVLSSLTGREELQQTAQDRPRLAVLMPAHNEASIIATSLRTVMPQLADSDTMLVVADNCSDETRAIAESEGAEVISRKDLVHRGKGYALDFGVRHLEQDPPAQPQSVGHHEQRRTCGHALRESEFCSVIRKFREVVRLPWIGSDLAKGNDLNAPLVGVRSECAHPVTHRAVFAEEALSFGRLRGIDWPKHGRWPAWRPERL